MDFDIKQIQKNMEANFFWINKYKKDIRELGYMEIDLEKALEEYRKANNCINEAESKIIYGYEGSETENIIRIINDITSMINKKKNHLQKIIQESQLERIEIEKKIKKEKEENRLLEMRLKRFLQQGG